MACNPVIRYVSRDGTEHHSEEECKDHTAKLDWEVEVEKIVKNMEKPPVPRSLIRAHCSMYSYDGNTSNEQKVAERDAKRDMVSIITDVVRLNPDIFKENNDDSA
jgi:hypothetical protein